MCREIRFFRIRSIVPLYKRRFVHPLVENATHRIALVLDCYMTQDILHLLAPEGLLLKMFNI